MIVPSSITSLVQEPLHVVRHHDQPSAGMRTPHKLRARTHTRVLTHVALPSCFTVALVKARHEHDVPLDGCGVVPRRAPIHILGAPLPHLRQRMRCRQQLVVSAVNGDHVEQAAAIRIPRRKGNFVVSVVCTKV